MVPENRPDGGSIGNEPGKVWVKDGKIFVKNPSGTGKVPTVTSCQEIDLFINGSKVEGKTVVKEQDEIVMKPHTSEEPGLFRIKVTPFGLTASLELKTGTLNRYIVQDREPNTDLFLVVTSQSEKTCPFNLAGLMHELAAQNVNYGVKHDEIRDVLANPEDGTYLIAEGDPPGETIDERVELNFATEPGEQKINVGSDKVDYRNLHEIPSVDPGALLAVKHPGVPGKPGKKVNSDIIAPKAPNIFEFKGGKGVEIDPDGSKVYARTSGSPIAKKLGNRYSIDVDPVLQKKGDVDISSGNIRFKGDVVIHGNVCEGMTVQASGKININGMVFDSQIGAQAGIIVSQNVTGSNIVAGSNSNFFQALSKTLETLHADLSETSKAISSLAQHPKLKDVKAGQLVQLLIDKKYPRVPGIIAEMIKISNQNSFIIPREIALFIEKIEKNLCGLNLLKLNSIKDFMEIISEMAVVRKTMDNMVNEKANIVFGYAVNSKIEASGDVMVGGRGCINTTIQAGGNVNIKGVFRGGEVIASGDVFLNEAGSEMGARTSIRTNEGKRVYIKRSHEGVRIQIGNRMSNIPSAFNIKAELDSVGALQISSTKLG